MFQHSKGSQASGAPKSSNLFGWSKRSNNSKHDSINTLVGSALERKEYYQNPIRDVVDTYPRLVQLRKLMARDNLDYYVVPTEDVHQCEYTAESDKRMEWLTNFTGRAGQAVITKTAAYLITDSRHWLQAERELDHNWVLIRAGVLSGPRHWVDWITDRVNESRVGLDARMISNEVAQQLYPLLKAKNSELVHPAQNLIDLIWEDKPARSMNKIFVQPIEYTGKGASNKLAQVRDWIRSYAVSSPSPSKSQPRSRDQHVGTLVSNLASVAYVLNLRGNDVPFNPVFISHLYIGLNRAILFVEQGKVEVPVREYLQSLQVEIRDYNAIWNFLRMREWGEGKARMIIPPQTSYAISLMLTYKRYSLAPSIVEEMRSVKNEVEIQGLKRACLRDGTCYVQFLAWLDEKMAKGFEISEWEAAWRLTEFRRNAKNFMGLAYENISATGPNAALPHYRPSKSGSYIIDKETPYLNGSGGQYRDGTCDTTRTVHFGRPTLEQSEAYTRVLQGHIAIDNIIFPRGTTGAQLDVLARNVIASKSLWQDGMNFLDGTGHAFLGVHEVLHGLSSSVPLTPGHVLTNEPGYYKSDEYGIRIGSVLVVRNVQTKHTESDQSWLGFERLTCVPIQTRMVLEHMLSKEEKEWLRKHNRECHSALEGCLRDDKRALKYLRREAERTIGPAGPGGAMIEWGE
ncbi:Creatinase/aminopeptidase [Russula earlei]|uniref:Creatinase/aminopeptidase n=1 Tax=Russula earlei TaxID=71964 RepID=A0ACC0U271_9AGAM|nr:Creatinase/aminopeptidase [Russula earlei]